MRAKPMVRAGVRGQKADAANQTKPQTMGSSQHHQQLQSNKMVLTSAGTLFSSAQQMTQDQLKQQQMQQQITYQQQQLINDEECLVFLRKAMVERQEMTVNSMPKASTLAPPTTKEEDKVDGSGEVAVVDTQLPHTDEAGTDQAVVAQVDQAKTETSGVKTDTLDEPARERYLPKALVKPEVRIHVIDGIVIQEAADPSFFVDSLLLELTQMARTEKEKRAKLMSADEPPLKKQALEGAKLDSDKCENCGKTVVRLKLKKGRRFCTVICKRAFSKRLPDGKGKDWGGDSADMDNNDSFGESSNPSPGDTSVKPSAMDQDDNMPNVNPLKWSVSDVCDFIRALPGCVDYAEDFAIQEIDGQALMLLKADHLMSVMSMELGPALKICAKIDTMRATTPQPGAQASPEK